MDKNKHNRTIITGDMNIDLKQQKKFNRFLLLINRYNFQFQLNTALTTTIHNSHLDWCISNFPVEASTYESHYSDHMPVTICWPCN